MKTIATSMISMFVGAAAACLAIASFDHRACETNRTDPKGTSIGASDSTADIRHAEVQLRAMLRDRPQMRSVVRWGDDLSRWAIQRFAGAGTGARVFWNPTPPADGFESDCLVGYDGAPLEIRLADLCDSPRAASSSSERSDDVLGEQLWSRAVYEFLNLENAPRVREYNKRLQANEANEFALHEWIEVNTRLEYSALLDLGNFYREVWVPHSVSRGRVPRPEGWGVDTPEYYYEWIGGFSGSRAEYPWVPWGRYYVELFPNHKAR